MQIYDQKGYFPIHVVYGDVINTAKQFKFDIYKLATSMNKLIRRDYDLSTSIHSLRHVCFDKNIRKLLVQLVGQTRN